ncbi:MAG: aspartate aminotransferase family protein [Thermoplasmata archaeon]|nr:aspartate aminotransferase family protein [Thermoplasmata archaeon]
MTAPEEWLSYPDAPRMLHLPPGPRSKELLAVQHRLETDAVVYPRHFPIAIAEARGATVEDVDGNRYIDWVSGISVLNLGHRHPKVQAAVEKQLARVWHALEIPTEARIEFLQELVASLPGGLRNHAKVLFTVTGGDAVETAVNLAEFATKRRGVVAFSGAYHGVHGGSVNLTSGRKYHETSAFHGGTIIRVPFPDPYRPVLDPDGGCANLMRYLDHLVDDPYSGVDALAGVVVEPILGEGGYVLPPDEFLPALRAFCDRHDLLLIVDEIQSGLGRTGRMWAVDHVGVTPDIVCIAKTIGGGIPLSLIAYRADLVPELPPAFHIGTFRANPLALAAGAEVLRLLRGGDLLERTARRGEETKRRFSEIATTHASIGDVRGRGFMIGVDFVKDGPGRTAWGDRAKAMRRELLNRGVLMHTCGANDNVLRFMAPLVIEDELLARGLDLFEASLSALDAPPVRTPTVPRSVTPLAGPALTRPPSIAPPIHPPPAPPPPGRSLP